MKKLVILMLILAAMIPNSAFAVSDKITTSVVEGFDDCSEGSTANFYISNDISAVRLDTDTNEKYLMLKADGEKVIASKTSRFARKSAVLGLKYRDLTEGSVLSVYAVNGSYQKVKIADFQSNKLITSQEEIDIENNSLWTKVDFIIDVEKNSCDVYIDSTLIKENINVEINSKEICGIEFTLEGEDTSEVKIDDVRCYAAETITDDYTLYNITGKVNYVVKDKTVLCVKYPKAIVNGNTMQIDENNASVKPFIENGRTLLPLRFASEAVGAKVEWYGEEKKIEIKSDTTEIVMHIGDVNFTVNGVNKVMDVPPVIYDGRTYVPIRIVSESLGKNVLWDDRGLIVLEGDRNRVDSFAEAAEIKDELLTRITGCTFVESNGRYILVSNTLDNYMAQPITIQNVTATDSDENLPAGAVDDDFATRWSSNVDGTELVADFGEVKNVSGYAIAWYSGKARKSHYEIYYSSDNVNWNLLEENTSTGDTENYEYYDTETFNARYVKYKGYGNTMNNDQSHNVWNSVAEIAFFAE